MKQDLTAIPKVPGVYLMKDRTGAVVYVGKAVNLWKRVSSYFQNRMLPPRIASLIANVQRLDYIVTSNEQEALVLENRLIKKYQPRFNTLLRDDKTYPYIVLTINEKFPRLFLTRNKKRE